MTAPSTMEMDAPEEWVKRYLAVLGVDRAAPSPAALADLTRAHVGAINFENTTSILRRAAHPTGPVPPLDPEALLANWERGAGGGVCYELAGMFGRLLAALGYRVFPILGQISFPASHQASLVELESGRVLVDIGNGAPFFDPIPLEGVFEVRHASLAYRFRPGDRAEEWLQERWIKGAWELFCRFDLGPFNATEQATGYQHHHTIGESWVVDRLRLVRCREAEVFSLSDDELVHFSANGKHVERISDLCGHVRLASEVFGLPSLPIADAIEVLANRTTLQAPKQPE